MSDKKYSYFSLFGDVKSTCTKVPCRTIEVILPMSVSIILLVVGIILVQLTTHHTTSNELVVDYTYCKKYPSGRCIDYNVTGLRSDCVCQHEFNVPTPLIGDVVLYYELDSDVQEGDSYVNSRDDVQLSGKLSTEPAASCEPYRYNSDGKPIAPCGQIADSMFSDDYMIRRPRPYLDDFNLTYYGMVKEDRNYRNPPSNRGPNDTLENAFEGFARPKSWTKNIWELDPNNTDNNGFQNERFIGWMMTSLRRKPAARLDPAYGGLPNGTYILRVSYSYPPSKYNGTRKVVFVATQTVEGNDAKPYGLVGISVGSLIMLFMFFYVGVVKLRRAN